MIIPTDHVSDSIVGVVQRGKSRRAKRVDPGSEHYWRTDHRHVERAGVRSRSRPFGGFPVPGVTGIAGKRIRDVNDPLIQ